MALLDHGGPPESAAEARPNAADNRRFPSFMLDGGFDAQPSDNDNDNQPARPGTSAAAELDCLRGVLPHHMLQAALRRGRLLGIGADQVLIHRGAINDDAYVRRLATHTGFLLHSLSDHDQCACAWSVERLTAYAATGIVPLLFDGQLVFVIAPRGMGARGLSQFAAAYPQMAGRIRLTTAHNLNRFLACQADRRLGRYIAHGLRIASPAFSAAPLPQDNGWRRRMARAARTLGLAALLTPLPPIDTGVWTSLLATAFLGFISLRLVASAMPTLPPPTRPRRSDIELPVYTIIAALYREARSVAPLLQAFRSFDYPAEKLDIILVTEADDPATRAAINRLGPIPHLNVLVAPRTGPKTKPKALDVALPFARGSFVAVFDAEDRPDADQLRAALDVFEQHGPELACAQASLFIDNASESLLSQMFAAEYAGQFDVFLPGLATLRLPLPLGGSSNHFRTDILRAVGGWDAYNVTEDADLGIRLARLGYRSATFASTTYEEAPIRFGPWLRQRSRWMKGWMQTWAVHMRKPVQLWREAGARGFLTINLIVGGNVLTALAYPLLVIELAALLWSGRSWPGIFADVQMPLYVTTFATGYGSTVAIGLLGLARRRQLRHGWVLLLAPAYWGLLSIAAWRALWQLWRDPYHWEKTEHGVSRRTKMTQGIVARYPGRDARKALRRVRDTARDSA